MARVRESKGGAVRAPGAYGRAMGWMWIYLNETGAPLADLPASAVTEPFPTQADAETWFGESWRELLAGGVESVSLFEGDRQVYGPMSLRPESH